jgi:hypothetical protein
MKKCLQSTHIIHLSWCVDGCWFTLAFDSIQGQSELRATTGTLVVVGKEGMVGGHETLFSSLSQSQIFSKSVVFFVEFTKDPSLIIIIIFNPLWKVCTYLQDHTYPYPKQSLVFMFIVYTIIWG